MDKAERGARIMIISALVRVVVWACMLGVYLLDISGVHHLYSETSFVTILSVLALLLTDWGQFAASQAQLAAAKAHKHVDALHEKVDKQLEDQ